LSATDAAPWVSWLPPSPTVVGVGIWDVVDSSVGVAWGSELVTVSALVLRPVVTAASLLTLVTGAGVELASVGLGAAVTGATETDVAGAVSSSVGVPPSVVAGGMTGSGRRDSVTPLCSVASGALFVAADDGLLTPDLD